MSSALAERVGVPDDDGENDPAVIQRKFEDIVEREGGTAVVRKMGEVSIMDVSWQPGVRLGVFPSQLHMPVYGGFAVRGAAVNLQHTAEDGSKGYTFS